MIARVRTTDRVVVAVVGLVLIVSGLLAVDWRAGLVLDLPDTIDASGVQDAVAAGWWPWVFAVVGVALALLGVWWLLALVPRRGPASARLADSDPTGTLSVDLRTVGSTAADRLAELGPLTGVRHRTRGDAAGSVLELLARLEPEADADAVAEAIHRCADEVERATSGHVALRVLVDAPGRSRPTDDRVRIR